MNKPKYKFGDTVTAIIKGKIVVDAKITSVMQYSKDGEARYFVNYVTDALEESSIFTSKKELIKSLNG